MEAGVGVASGVGVGAGVGGSSISTSLTPEVERGGGVIIGIGVGVANGVGVGVGGVGSSVSTSLTPEVERGGGVIIGIGVAVGGYRGLGTGSSDWGVTVGRGVSAVAWTDASSGPSTAACAGAVPRTDGSSIEEVGVGVGAGSEEQDRTASEHTRRTRRDRAGQLIDASGCGLVTRLPCFTMATSLLMPLALPLGRWGYSCGHSLRH